MHDDALEEMGPIDYLLVEWPGRRPDGELAPYLIDLVDRGLIRVLDLAFVVKDEDGNVTFLDIETVADEVVELAVFAGAASDLLDEEDRAAAAGVLEPGTAAALLIYENTWAAPFAGAVRRSGGQLVASGRIPIQAMLATLEAAETT